MINVTVGEQKTQSEKPFPKLMKTIKGSTYDERIVLITSTTEGTLLVADKKDYMRIGEHCDGWNINSFVDFDEPITLQNA